MKFGIYTLVIESHFRKLNFYEFNNSGWGCGYVLLPFDHPFYGIDYDHIDINVHGGLTFGCKFAVENFLEWIKDREICGDVTLDNFEKLNNYWIIGFDTNHYGDNLFQCSKDYVIFETNNMLEQCLNDDIEGMKKYKLKFFRLDKLKKINASVLALSSKQNDA